MTSEAVRTNSSCIVLGNSLSEFLRDVGLDPKTGRGKRGDARRLKAQMERLFRAKISFDYESGELERWKDMQVAPEGQFWWDYKNPDHGSFFDSWLDLDPRFFAAITATPVSDG